jgi:hypothetical protein
VDREKKCGFVPIISLIKWAQVCFTRKKKEPLMSSDINLLITYPDQLCPSPL